MQETGCLTILPGFGVRRTGESKDSRVILTGKFLTGVEEFRRHWGGKVRVIVEENNAKGGGSFGGNLDDMEVAPAELPFELTVTRYDNAEEMRLALQGSAIALLAVHFRQMPLARLCKTMNIPVVFVAENSLRTKMQMVGVERVNPVVKLRRAIWLLGEERRVRAGILQAAGVQCNGVPTFEAYVGIAKNALLYFDSRVTADMLATTEGVEKKAQRLREGEALRLAFSGRLVAIKGADHLVLVADELHRRGVKFEMSICGGGEMEPAMKAEVTRRNLQDTVHFKGVLNFEKELIPFIRDQVDVFVCCHRQGDPSCTYLETMACGVPIAGYANEAFAGIVQKCAAGWPTPMNRPAELADKIAALTPDEIQKHATQSLIFAREHTFENTFAHRAKQLQRLAKDAIPDAPSKVDC